jgi:hypothetical protein
MVLSILLNFSLKAEHSFLHLSLLNKFPGSCKKVDWCRTGVVQVWVLLVKSDECRVTAHFEFCVFVPSVTPSFHHIIHFFHLLHLTSFLHPLLHHLLHLFVIKLFFALKNVLEHARLGIHLIAFLLLFLFFFLLGSSHFLFLPLIAQISVDTSELFDFFLIFDELISLHFIGAVV